MINSIAIEMFGNRNEYIFVPLGFRIDLFQNFFPLNYTSIKNNTSEVF